MEAIPMKMKTEETIKLIKYVTGSVAAVLLAAALQLQFAYAAGIITLLLQYFVHIMFQLRAAVRP